jgi:hypothetical protein
MMLSDCYVGVGGRSHRRPLADVTNKASATVAGGYVIRNKKKPIVSQADENRQLKGRGVYNEVKTTGQLPPGLVVVRSKDEVAVSGPRQSSISSVDTPPVDPGLQPKEPCLLPSGSRLQQKPALQLQQQVTLQRPTPLSDAVDRRERLQRPSPPTLSPVAQMFQGRASPSSGVPDKDIEAVLPELVDGFLRSCHLSSQRHLPCPKTLIAKLQGIERGTVLHWLVQACDIMNFHDSVLHSTVLTLDRYCATEGVQMSMDRIQRVLMAVLCTILKVTSVQDELGLDDSTWESYGPMPLRDMLAHLCHGQVSFRDILHEEYRVLTALKFEVSAPSAFEFLDVLTAPLGSVGEVQGCTPRSLAHFLLQMSLFHVSLLYQYPHLVLAASALYVAMVSLRVPCEIIATTLSGVAEACPEVSDVIVRIGHCSCQLHSLWLEFAMSGGTTVPSLMIKLGAKRLSKEIIMRPPPLAALPESALQIAKQLEPEQEGNCWPRPGLTATRLR